MVPSGSGVPDGRPTASTAFAGWLTLQHLAIESFDREEYLLFSAVTDSGKSLDQETCERLFYCSATVEPLDGLAAEARDRLVVETNLHADAAVARSLERRLFARWPELHITGVDLCPKMLAQAQEKHIAGDVTWIEAGASELPVPTASSMSSSAPIVFTTSASR